MKTLIAFLILAAAPLAAADSSTLDSVRQADDARTAALIAGDRPRLESILSDDLRYAHSSGAVNGKQDYLAAEVGGHTVFRSFDYEDRHFREAAPGVVLMYGRVLIKEETSGRPVSHHLNFLGVWRNEGGAWRFLAWQSCELPKKQS